MVSSILKLQTVIPLQTVDVAKELLYTKEVTIIGVLLFIIGLLLTAVIYLYKRNEKLVEKRVEEQRSFTTELISITKETGETVRQVNEILKITKNV